MTRLPYELFIALRYLRAKKRHKAVSLNTFISIGGVTLGVAALIATPTLVYYAMSYNSVNGVG